MDFIVIEGDIARQRADALVAASDTSLAMTGGTARALRDAGGEELHEAAIDQAPVEPGEAIVTEAFGLRADYVVHAAAKPVGGHATEESVHAATRNALAAADGRDCQSVVLPVLGSGVGGLGTDAAADAMIEELDRFDPTTLTDVRVVAYSDDDRYRVQERVDRRAEG